VPATRTPSASGPAARGDRRARGRDGAHHPLDDEPVPARGAPADGPLRAQRPAADPARRRARRRRRLRREAVPLCQGGGRHLRGAAARPSGEGGVHQHRPRRCLSRRRPAGGDLRARTPGRARRGRDGHRQGRTPPPQHDPEIGLPLSDAGADALRQRRPCGLPGEGARPLPTMPGSRPARPRPRRAGSSAASGFRPRSRRAGSHPRGSQAASARAAGSTRARPCASTRPGRSRC